MADHLSVGDLRLDVVVPSDLADVHAIFSDPLTHTIGDGPITDPNETRAWLERRQQRRREQGVAWYAVRNARAELIGTCGLFMGRTTPHPELGFEIRRPDQGRGYGRAVARAVVAEAHRAGIAEVWATVRERNVGSLRALDAIGFVRHHVEPETNGSLVYLRHSDERRP